MEKLKFGGTSAHSCSASLTPELAVDKHKVIPSVFIVRCCHALALAQRSSPRVGIERAARKILLACIALP